MDGNPVVAAVGLTAVRKNQRCKGKGSDFVGINKIGNYLESGNHALRIVRAFCVRQPHSSWIACTENRNISVDTECAFPTMSVIRPLAVRCVPRDRERSRTPGAFLCAARTT